MTARRGGGEACRGQLLELPPGRYDWIYLDLVDTRRRPAPAGAPPRPGRTRRVDYEVWLHYQGGVDPEWLKPPVATDGPARVPVPRHDILVGFRLPDRPTLLLTGLRLVESRPDPGDWQERI